MDLHRQVRRWDTFDAWSTGIQLVRAAESIPANIAEGYGRGSRADRRRFLLIARGSHYELEHWLEMAAALDLPLPPNARLAAAEIGRMLNGLLGRS